MTENNSEQTETNTELSVDTDATGTTETIDAVASESSNEGEVLDTSESAEGAETTNTDDNLFYDLDGEEVSVSQVREWKNNGLMQADYTKKTQAAAEVRKQAEAETAKTVELNAKLAETVGNLEQSIKDEFKSIDWDYLRENDTGEYLKQKELINKKAQLAKKAKADLAARQEQEETQRISTERQSLRELNPTWADPKQYEADLNLIDQYVTDKGFTLDEVKGLTNHKVMSAVLDAARYKALKGKSEEVSKEVQNAPKVLKASVKQKATTTQKSGTDLWYPKTG